LAAAGIAPGPTGVEVMSLPHAIAEWLREAGLAPVACDAAIASRGEPRRRPISLRSAGASRLADVVQQRSRTTPRRASAKPSSRVSQLRQCIAKPAARAGHLTVSAGAEASATGEASRPIASYGRASRPHRHVTVDRRRLVGLRERRLRRTPDRETVRRFDAVRRALHEGISLCRPGVIAREVDRQVRDLLADFRANVLAPHGTWHRRDLVGGPAITPYCDLAARGGDGARARARDLQRGLGRDPPRARLRRRAGGNEILTQFEHTL